MYKPRIHRGLFGKYLKLKPRSFSWKNDRVCTYVPSKARQIIPRSRLNQDIIQAIAEAIVERLLNAPTIRENEPRLLPGDPIKYSEAIRQTNAGNTKVLREYLMHYQIPKN